MRAAVSASPRLRAACPTRITPCIAEAQMPGARRALQRANTSRQGASAISFAKNASQSATRSVLPSAARQRSEEHTSELQSLAYLVCRLLLEKKKKNVHN